MYEELIQRLEHAAGGPEGIKMAHEAADAIAALQTENAQLREEKGCLQHNVAAMQATLDQQAKNCEVLLAEKDKEIKAYEIIMKTMPAQRDEATYRMKAAEVALSRVEAERDAACEAICDRCEYVPCRREACMWWRGAQGEV